eukprot:Lithocolla_globosa_v1_NODE_2669_length_1912_cov_39.137857.p2 type:complete len:122 gc:universal NODE_2669_length_1912_cov_39.137857:1159-1524(+)
MILRRPQQVAKKVEIFHRKWSTKNCQQTKTVSLINTVSVYYTPLRASQYGLHKIPRIPSVSGLSRTVVLDRGGLICNGDGQGCGRNPAYEEGGGGGDVRLDLLQRESFRSFVQPFLNGLEI